jgi:hypothetical protein
MDILIQNALPIGAMLISAIIALRLEFVRKHKLLWAGVAFAIVIALFVFLAIVGATLSEYLLITLIILLVCTA